MGHSLLQATSTCSTRGLSTGRRGTAAACLEHLLPSFCTDLGGCRAASHSSLPAAVVQQVFSFLKCALPEAQPASLMAQLWPAAGPFWIQLELTLICHGAAAGLCSQRPPLRPPATTTFPHKPSTQGPESKVSEENFNNMRLQHLQTNPYLQ